MSVALCIIFNHPFPKNIPHLRRMYGPKFDKIIFVQPLVVSEEEDVFTSYRGSFTFQGIILDAIPHLQKLGCDYVVILQDDCVLNPYFDEDNIIEELRVTEDRPYFGYFKSLGGAINEWYWGVPTVWRTFYNSNAMSGTGVENFLRYLPDANGAREHIRDKFNIEFKPITRPVGTMYRYNTAGDYAFDHKIVEVIINGMFKTAPLDEIDLNYPWLFGPSDFLVLSMKSLNRMAGFLGATTAAGIFVEVAIPTALAVYHDEISNSGNTNWHVDYVWGLDRDDVSLEAAKNSFASGCAMIHPIKMSTHLDIVKELYGLD